MSKHSFLKLGTALGAALALTLGSGGAAIADPVTPPTDPLPPKPAPEFEYPDVPPELEGGVAPRHAITCFYQAIGPAKQGLAPVSPMSFGMSVSCTDTPDLRGITTILWRYDFDTGEYYRHSERYSNERNTQQTLTYYASCSGQKQYAFHTQVIGIAYHGNWDETSDDSDAVIEYC